MSLKNMMFAFSVCWAGMLFATDLVKNGTPGAVIVLPEKPSRWEILAAKELQHHIRKASGAALEIVRGTTSSPLDKVYIGRNDGVELASLGRNGFRIRNVGRDLVISGIGEGSMQGVYSFLENQMGVRWIWPGELGEVVPRSKNLSFDDLNIAFKQPLESSRIHPSNAGKRGWQDLTAHRRFTEACLEWYRRMGFSWITAYRSQHSWGHPGWKYGEKYMKTHPEYFNMLPDGTRRPNPFHVVVNPEFAACCPSSDGLIRQVLKDWQEKGPKGYPFGPCVYVGENDTDGCCCCPACLAADRSGNPNRLERARKKFEAKDPTWTKELGDVSERYAAFYMKVLKEAKKIDPKARVVAFCAYANYNEPPKCTKLDKDLILNYVGRIMYPWTPEKVAEGKRIWKGWHDAGATMILRPNFMLDGHNMPINFSRKFYDFYQFCLANGMVGTEYDSDIGQFAGNGFNYYVMSRLIRSPGLTYDRILSEYCDAFGPAKDEIREYLAACEKISDSKETADAVRAVRFNPVGAEIGSWNYFYTRANAIYTPAVFDRLDAVLKRAADKAAKDPVAAKRVKFLRDGLLHARLTAAAQTAYETKDKYKLADAVSKLDAFRKKIEPEFAANMFHLVTWENVCWERDALKFLLNAPGSPITDGWTFAFDPQKKGIAEKWYLPSHDASGWAPIGIGSGWESQDVGKKWKKEHADTDYDGIGWYRRTLTIPKEDEGKTIFLTFGAVDEACTVWVNGQQVLDRPYPFKGDTNSWATPFVVDISKVVKAGDNVLVVRVSDTCGQGGIWRPVWIRTEAKEAENPNPNLIKNPGFELRGPNGSGWPSHRVHGKYSHGFTGKTVRSGKFSYFMKCTEINPKGANVYEIAWMRVFQSVTVRPGKTYSFRVRFKTSPDYKGEVRIWVLGKGVRKDFVAKSTQGLWHTCVFPEIVTGKETEKVTVYLNVDGGLGEVWFDDAELKEK